jgi:transcriptional regulator with XRE-family HTH domain
VDAVDRQERASIGTRIAQARRESGMTQADLASTLSVTVRSIQNYESGVSVPYRHLRAIEALAHKRPGWILDGDGDGALDAKIAMLHEMIEAHKVTLQEHLRLMREHTDRMREQRDVSARARARRR